MTEVISSIETVCHLRKNEQLKTITDYVAATETLRQLYQGRSGFRIRSISLASDALRVKVASLLSGKVGYSGCSAHKRPRSQLPRKVRLSAVRRDLFVGAPYIGPLVFSRRPIEDLDAASDGDAHDQFAKILSVEKADEGAWRVFQPIDNILPVF